MTTWILLGTAAFAAGVINAIAGGGSLITFPALLGAGLPATIANATNTVAVWPGTLSSVFAYQRHLAEERHRALVLAVPSLVGGLGGSWLLLHTSEESFRAVVPWLILFACALLAAQAPVARFVAARTGSTTARVPAPLWIAQLLIAVYGGYFGAGIGILMLAGMAIFIPHGLQAANALKVLFSCLINGIAAVYFVALGAVRFQEAGVMMICSIAGGWLGAHLAQRLPATWMRVLVIAFGLSVALKLLVKG
ncbi:MAG TPA: sulfite exporter TauE/SafE family protein [Anaeromyxobacteraceae bacterium]|nr:sulfite exporter TauE/SafE family protein [Anaeromyxobacteraceae bacterium]